MWSKFFWKKWYATPFFELSIFYLEFPLRCIYRPYEITAVYYVFQKTGGKLRVYMIIKFIFLSHKKLDIELGPSWLTHRVISDRVHRLLVTLSYFRPDRFVQLLSLIPILILLLYYLVSGCLTSLC